MLILVMDVLFSLLSKFEHSRAVVRKLVLVGPIYRLETFYGYILLSFHKNTSLKFDGKLKTN